MSSARPYTAAGEVHPALLQPVTLTLTSARGREVDLGTRVLDLEPDDAGGAVLVVACPEGAEAEQPHPEATVTWTYPFGRMVCQVSTRPASRPYGPVWLLRVSAEPTRVQQRAYFRAQVSAPVVLTWSVQDADEEAEPEAQRLVGRAVDLSEGGVFVAASDVVPEIGALVVVSLRIEGEELEHAGRVVRHVIFTGGGIGVALTFVDPASHGDRIRRLVFEAERRRRRQR